jgi:CelD/BcsL family acetyltransferase involved in cellulose biosynthesis
MLVESARALRLEVIRSVAGLEALRVEWSQLATRSPRATPFQTPRWLLPWWRAFGNDQLHAVALRAASDARLVALMPAYVLDDCWQFIGIGNSDHLDFLAEPAFEQDAAAMLLEYASGEDWPRIELQQLPPDSPLVAAPTPAGWESEIAVQDVCPVLTLPATIESLGECVSPHQLRNLRYYRKQAEKAGAVEFETANLASLDEICDALLALHGQRWAERGAPGVMSEAAVTQFLKQATAELLGAGMLRLYAMRIERRIVAALCGLVSGRRFHYYISGFDPGLARLCLGHLLVGHAIEQAIAERLAEFDFLRGGESYKYLWGARDCPNCRRQLRRL